MKLYGRNPVIEKLRTDPRSIKKIYIQEGHKDLSMIRNKVRKFGIGLHIAPKSKLQKIARNSNTQGIIAEIGDFPYMEYADLLEQALDKKRVPVFLDEVSDPQNLGAMIRSLACLGKFSLVLPTHKSVNVTESVLRVASGGENYVPIARVGNINNAIKKAKEAGYWIAGTVVDDGTNIFEAKLPGKIGFVVGSEQKGIRGVVAKNLDIRITVPMSHHTLSLNVAHAAAVVAFEIERQRFNAKEKNK